MKTRFFKTTLITIIVLLGSLVTCFAQNLVESKEVYFRFTEVKKVGNDSILATIHIGKKLGLEVGNTGSIIANNDTKSERRLIELGYGSIVEVTDSTSTISINRINKSSTKANYEIRIGDYIKMEIDVPKLAYRSIFFELGLLDIEFTDIHQKRMYSFQDLFYNDSKAKEDAILTVCKEDIISTYERVKDYTDSSFLIYKKPLADGRYIGKSIFDVMADCKNKDVYAFLNYVKRYPNYYLGKDYKVPEPFVDWVYTNPTYSSKEVYDSVKTYANKPALLKQFIKSNLPSIISNRYAILWISDAVDATNDNRNVQATEILENAKILLPYLQDSFTTGYYFYGVGTLKHNQEQYKAALSIWDSAYTYFAKGNSDYFKILIHQKRGFTYSSLAKDDESLNAFEKMFALVNDPAIQITDEQKTTFSARYYYYTGILIANKGELKKAAEHYANAIKLYQSIGDYDNLKTAGVIRNKLAKLYVKQGELAKALEIYNQQLVQYRSLADKKNEADALDNVAEVQFNLGNYRTSIDNYSSARDIHLSFKNLNNAGYSQSNIGQAYWNLGKYDSAISAHNIALDYRKKSGSNGGQAYSWKKIASLYKLTGEKNKALIAYDSAANYYTLAKDSSSLKDLLTDIGDVYLNDKQYQKAFSYYYRVYVIDVSKKNKADIVNSSYNLGNSSFYFNVDSSRKYFTNSYTIAKEIGDKSNELYAGINLGSLYYKQLDFAKGEIYFTNALKIAQSEKNKFQEANCYRLIANANLVKLEFDNTISYYEKAIAIYDSLGEKASLPELYRSVGNTLYTKGDFNESKKWFQKSIDLARSINSRAEVGYSYNAITFLYSIQGDLSKAQAATDTAYSIFKELNNSWQMADTYANKGLVAQAKNDGINAVKYYSMADSIYMSEKDNFSHSLCQTNIGCVFYYQADFDHALTYFVEADKILAKINYESEAHLLAPANIGAAYYYKKDYTNAEKYLVDSYKKSTAKKVNRIINISANFLGMTYFETKKYTESEKYLLESYKLSQQMNESDMLIQSGMSLGRLYIAQKNETKGIDYLRSTVQYAKSIENSKYTWEILFEYGLSFYNQNKYDSAIVYFKQAVTIVENSSQNLFGGAEAKKLYNADARKVDLYNKLVAALAKTGNKEEALFYADKSNNQAIKEQIEKSGFATDNKEKQQAIKIGGELLQKQNAVEMAISKEKAKPEKEQNKELIASLESIQKIAQKDYINYINTLVKKYPDMQAYFSKTNPVDFKNNMKYIPDSTLAVLYIINDNQLFIFTATKQEIGIKTIELKKDINKQAERFLGVLRNPANVTGTGALRLQRSTIKSDDGIKGDFKSEASILYDMLITPILDQLKDKKNICIIPNSKLSNIPFQALGTIANDGQFHFLVEDYAIFYTNKMDIFSKPFEHTNIANSFIALGNPDKTLPNAAVEVNNFSKIIKNAAIFTENAATETKATEGLSNYQYVHFATHGILDYAEFEKSYLVFATDKGSTSDGKLTIEKINGLSISNCRLVTLSACETAVSKESIKGWYISPANSFLQNNVGSVVASLWKVDDEATSVLMTEFYKNLASMSMTQALRAAQETLSKDNKYAHPYFWSAFVLYGEWR